LCYPNTQRITESGHIANRKADRFKKELRKEGKRGKALGNTEKK
jgi:hypothetical protein